MLRGPVRLAQIALACVCTTALGLLVVPDVNMIPNGTSGSMSRPPHSLTSPSNDAKGSQPWLRWSSEAGSPELSSVTAIHFKPGPASTTIAAYCGCVIAATHCALSTKYAISAATDFVLVVTPTAPSV